MSGSGGAPVETLSGTRVFPGVYLLDMEKWKTRKSLLSKNPVQHSMRRHDPQL
jgi:hypothetical protein